MAVHEALPSLGFSRQEHWSGLPLPSPMHESESEVAQSCPTFCDPMDCSLPGSSVHGIFQARLLEWVAIAFCKSPNVGSYKETFVSAQVLVGNRKHTILMGMKGLSTEVCTWLRNPTARFDFMTGLEGAKGRKSVAEALRELQFWRPLGLPRGSSGDCGRKLEAEQNALTSPSVHWPNTAGSQRPRLLGTVQLFYCCITNYPKAQRLETINVY